MKTQDFESLKEFILSKNTFFSEGYANAFIDSETEAVYSYVNGDLKVIFPDDRVGNYFYLRNDSSIKFALKTGYQECGIGKFNFDDTLTCYLIAVVNGADEYDLLTQLRNTCLSYSKLICIPSSAITQTENVIVTEMSGFEKETIWDTLKNLKNKKILRLQITISKEFIPNNCIIDPCKNC